jgi:hypothetical protein
MVRLLHPCRRTLLIVLWTALITTSGTGAYETKPKFGPDAIPIEQATDYLRTHPAPHYWAISPFYIPQDTGSACSVASIAIMLNVLRGVPERADAELVTQDALRAALDDAQLTTETADHGPGVTFAKLREVVAHSLHLYDLESYGIETFKPTDAPDASLARLRSILAAYESSSEGIMLIYFNQGVLTGDWDGPHISPVGAFDAGTGRVLIMDVDRRFYIPYWSSVSKVLESMLKPAPARFGPLAGETGGLVWVRPRRH